MASMNIDLNPMRKELRGLVYKIIHEELKKFDLEKYMKQYISTNIDKFVKKWVKQQVYKYMEESEIVMPDEEYYDREKRIALNTFVIQIIRESITDKIVKILEPLKIEITKDGESIILGQNEDKKFKLHYKQ